MAIFYKKKIKKIAQASAAEPANPNSRSETQNNVSLRGTPHTPLQKPGYAPDPYC